MDFETIGRHLLGILVVGVQGLMVYGLIRLSYVKRSPKSHSLFKSDWKVLHGTYGVEKGIPRMETISAYVGMAFYRNAVDIGFDEHHLLLRAGTFSPETARIPYADIRIVKEPGANTVLRIKVRTDGIFSMGGVEVSLHNREATRSLIRRVREVELLPNPERV